MRLGDYADGAWMFVATCDTCGRQTRVDPAEVLTHPRTHSHVCAWPNSRSACAVGTAATAPRGSTPSPACPSSRLSQA